MSRPNYDFFCYWQQDDVTSTDYISALLRGAVTHPSAVCCCCDILWTGSMTGRMAVPSVTGSAFDRAMAIFETLNGVPLRGLIRKQAIDRVGPIRRTPHGSAFEDIVWLAKLAREGSLHRVEGPSYFKRAHQGSTHLKWFPRDRSWKRAVWLEFGLGMLETIWPVVPEAERVGALAVVLDRLCLARPGRLLFYDGPAVPFATDFVFKALQRFSIPVLERAMAGVHADAPLVGGATAELLNQAIGWSRRAMDAVEPSTRFQFRLGDPGIDLLGSGWSVAEDWGTWSDGPRAALRLPVGGKRGTWKAAIAFRAFGKQGTDVPVDVTVDCTSETFTWSLPANTIVQKELSLEPRSGDVVLTFGCPQATSPLQLGFSDDRRRLGIGLISLDLNQST